MNQPRPANSSNSNKNPAQPNDEVIQQFLANQKAQLYNEAEDLKLRQKELEINSKLAERSMEFQAAHLAKQPLEGRKTITRLAYIVGGLIILFFLFIGYCLSIGQVDFITNFLKTGGYVLTTGMGYWFGRRVGKENEKNKDKDLIEDAQIVK